ncbi:uncharacterized protein JN550_003026 [Neoarthrinium moseri]|uniref:uncharacterized protein n=1 Tax=Neoarthrinium moseri TaxID=1658444 RepID=UPI001FDE443E|nr:uncharacterized protein JN550_003026 [Neoarthrinium moseri]KAI1873757.1 hypothetical protein JN550_003026 [Neoarthrinium moseri]
MDNGKGEHTCLRTECGICGGALLGGVRFLPLASGEVSPEQRPYLDSAIFPMNRNANLNFNSRLLCWDRNCWRCPLSSEVIAIHSDCFRIFSQEVKADDALERLWVAAVSRSSWRMAPSLRLEQDTNVDVDLVYEKAAIQGVPRLRLLSPELVQMVRDHSKPATFWRYISVLSFSRELAAASSDRSLPTSIPLQNFAAWARGREAVLLEPPGEPPVIRLTIDAHGIKEVERLPRRRSYHPWRSDKMVYMIEEASSLGDYNTLYLKLPQHIRGFHIWDLRSPPMLEDCLFSTRIPQSTLFRTVDLEGVSGLTFFYCTFKFYAVHAHTPSNSCAKQTFDRLVNKKSTAWIHLPMPKGEEIIALGVRFAQAGTRGAGGLVTQRPYFMVRTKLAGDVFLGPPPRGEGQDIILSQLHPRLFIYNSPNLGPATVFGAYPGAGSNDPLFSPFRQPSLAGGPPPLGNLSTAPLENVTRIQILEDADLGFCRAVVFDYTNGAQRAVGDCRLGVDPAKTYLRPSRICYLPTLYPRGLPSPGLLTRNKAVKVESGSESIHRHDQDGWVCSPLEGTLEFLFSGNQSVITIASGSDDQGV